MIESIEVKSFATFDDDGVEIIDLKKINFVYGANGSGKTTISNYLTNPSKEEYKNCTITWKQANKLPTLVYNKQFRETNFGTSSIKGVFTLGKATKEEKEKIKVHEKLRDSFKEQHS